MYNRIRIVYIICLSMIIYTSFNIIALIIPMSLLAGLGLIYSFKATYPYAIFIIILIIIIMRCRKKYAGDNSDLTIKSNLFFLGFSLLIWNGVSILLFPLSIINIFSSLSKIPTKHLMNTIIGFGLLIMEVGLGIVMIRKDHKIRQEKTSIEEEKVKVSKFLD